MTLFCRNTTFTCSNFIKMKKWRYIRNITIIIILTNIIGACGIYLECNLGSHLRVKLGRNQRQDCINATLFVFHNHHHRQHHLLSSSRPPMSTLTLQLPCAHPISPDSQISWVLGGGQGKSEGKIRHMQSSTFIKGLQSVSFHPIFQMSMEQSCQRTLFIFQIKSIKCFFLLPSYYFMSIVSKTCRKGFLVAPHFFGIYGQIVSAKLPFPNKWLGFKFYQWP